MKVAALNSGQKKREKLHADFLFHNITLQILGATRYFPLPTFLGVAFLGICLLLVSGGFFCCFPGEFFVVEADIKEFTQLKVDKRFHRILNILRHCQRVREVRGARLVRYVIC